MSSDINDGYELLKPEQEPKRGEAPCFYARLYGCFVVKLSDHAAKVAELKREIERLSSLKESTKTCGELSCDDCNARYCQLLSENDDLRKQLAEAKVEVEERTRQPAEVVQIRNWFDAFQGGAEKILEMSCEYVDLKNDNEELKQVNTSYDKKLTHARGEIRNAESQLAAEREKRRRLREGIEDAMSALNEDEERLDKAWAALRSARMDDDAGGGE